MSSLSRYDSWKTRASDDERDERPRCDCRDAAEHRLHEEAEGLYARLQETLEKLIQADAQRLDAIDGLKLAIGRLSDIEAVHDVRSEHVIRFLNEALAKAGGKS